MKHLLTYTALVTCMALLPSFAQADDLKPRVEVNMRAGTERSILMTEFWTPLAQKNDHVLYGDLRLMGDDGDNREGNLGIGYRELTKQSVLGAHAWIDRRRTENGNNFHQLTLGVEALGDTIDVRANTYIQLNNSKTKVTPNIGNSTPYLAGSGLFFDTNGFIIEEPQDGFDAEIGYRLPVLQKYIDATRVYAGGYHFFGKLTEDVTGFRIRGEAQVNSIFSVGARFQHDDPRGSQGFLEATLRFPFSSKKTFQNDGLRSRLDESPERDIDIVTGAKVNSGLMQPILNSGTGQIQRILHVDNTAGAGGDGTKERPFNTVLAAQQILADNDVLYVHRGDGTTTGQDQGIRINKNNVYLVGSGTDFIFDSNRFTTQKSGQVPSSGTVIVSASNPTLITNTETYVDDYTSNGITITGNNIVVAGFHVDATLGNGIAILAKSNETVHNIDIYDNIVTNTSSLPGSATYRSAIIAATLQNGHINNINISNNIISGVAHYSDITLYNLNTAGGQIQNVNIRDNNSTSSAGTGILLYNQQNGVMTDISISNFQSTGNKFNGILMQNSGNGISGVSIKDSNITGAKENGIKITASGTSNLSTSMSGNIITGNSTITSQYGIFIDNDSTGTFNVDLGGGSLGSTGHNSIYNNLYRDIFIDSRPGTAAATTGSIVSAQNNWWGISTGLNQATRATFDNGSAGVNGSRIDASNQLITAP